MRLIGQANSHYRSGDYAGAYNLYLAAASRYKSIDLSFNMALCKRALAESGAIKAFGGDARVRDCSIDLDFSICRSNKPSISIVVHGKQNLRNITDLAIKTDLPFNLRFFCNTADGMRPLHDVELLDVIDSNPRLIGGIVALPESDFCLTLDKNEALTEYDVVRYFELKTGLLKQGATSLNEVENNSRAIKQGRISVIIPTYRRPKNLKRAIQSVLSQDYHDIELIVINDNGMNSEFNAETRRIVESFQGAASNCAIFYYEHERNRNGSAARNTGILNSTGEYISFLDDDDIYLPGRLSKSIHELWESPKDTGAVYCGYYGWNSSENDVNRYKSGNLALEILMLDYKSHYLHTNTVTYKREAVLSLNGFDETYSRHQDLEFNLRFFENYNIETVNECLVQLNPEPSGVNNKPYDRAIIDLKKKFLTRFASIIRRFDSSEVEQIYINHWDEVRRNIRISDPVMERMKTDYQFWLSQQLPNINNVDKK
jgi:glycosyltransferase involved in cell wall biosynthesis